VKLHAHIKPAVDCSKPTKVYAHQKHAKLTTEIKPTKVNAPKHAKLNAQIKPAKVNAQSCKAD
jgi:hypothetical protein